MIYFLFIFYYFIANARIFLVERTGYKGKACLQVFLFLFDLKKRNFVTDASSLERCIGITCFHPVL